MKYKLMVTSPISAYILDTEEGTVVTICETKRPDKEFKGLKKMIEYANLYVSENEEVEAYLK